MSDRTESDSFDVLAERDAQKERLMKSYELLKLTKQLSRLITAEYRCPRRCLLAHIFQTPEGAAVYLPAYRLAPTVNAATSNDEGRRENTTDGDRRWGARAFYLAPLLGADGAIQLDVSCQHVAHYLLSPDAVAAESGGPGDPTRRTLP